MADARLSSEDGDDQEVIPTATFFGYFQIYKPDGRFWFDCGAREGITSFRTEFQGRDDDIFLASFMKTGSNWLIALCTNILIIPEDVDANADKINLRSYFTTVETTWYESDHRERLAAMPSPRRIHTHIPFQWWPQAVKNSGCKVVYITRNPKDTFVSLWHFVKQFNFGDTHRHDYPLEEAFREFCDGEVWYGPFHDHVLEFWEESLKRPEKVLFLRYEELKRDTRGQVKKLAEFLGKPLRSDEDVDKVIWRSSLDMLKKLEVNSGNKKDYPMIPNNLYYRRGVVGDWRNYFTPEMQQKLNQITLSKFQGTGLHIDDI